MQHIDPLLTADLPSLLRQFDTGALLVLLEIMSATSLSPFPAKRAEDARKEPPGADLRVHAAAIAEELFWWGSNDINLDLGKPSRDWTGVLATVARSQGLSFKDIADTPAWRVEELLIKRVLPNWEAMSGEQRKEVMRKAGIGLGAAKGGITAAAGGAMAAAEGLLIKGGPQLAKFLAARFAPAAVVPIAAPVLTVLGTAWAAYDLAGPSHRVIRPAVLLIALTRVQLREQRNASAFED